MAHGYFSITKSVLRRGIAWILLTPSGSDAMLVSSGQVRAVRFSSPVVAVPR